MSHAYRQGSRAWEALAAVCAQGYGSGMAKRHDYRARPEPRWEDGRFVPPFPNVIEKRVSDWDRIDWLRYILAAAKNPMLAVTREGIETHDVVVHSQGYDFFVPTSPAAIREAFVEKADRLRHSDIRNAILKPALREGLLTAEGARWRQDRRALAPVFTPRRVDGFADTIARATADLLPGLLAGNAVAFDQLMVELTYGVLSQALFSGDLERGRTINLREIDRFLNTMGRPDPLDFVDVPQWIPRLSRVGRMGPVKRLRRFITEIVEERRAAPDAARDDLLSVLLAEDAFDEGQLQDQLITFIAAGHETTSRALTWLFYLLSQDHSARDRLEAEVDALDTSRPAICWPEHLPFVRACFDEAMRLYPPAPFLSRQLSEDTVLAGQAMNKNAIVFCNIAVVHRHRLQWDQPDAFVPERFLEGAPEAVPIDRYQYLPFGVGPRVCIGARFAVLEAVILIAEIARRYRLDLDGPHPWPVARVTVRPEQPLQMRVSRR